MMDSLITREKTIHGLVWLLGFDLVDGTVSTLCGIPSLLWFFVEYRVAGMSLYSEH